MRTYSFLIFFLFLYITSDAQKAPIPQQFAKTQLSLTENKGQITDQYGQPRNDIQFKTRGNGVSVFVGNGHLHYQFSKANNTGYKADLKSAHSLLREHDTAATACQMYRLDMTLEGANPDATMIADDKQAYYETYYTTALHTNAPAASYGKVTYKDIYPNIDWVLYIKDGKLEYDFVVRPGGKASYIKIKYNGATAITHTAGRIHIATPMGDVNEEKLYAYEQGTGKPVAARFCGKGNNVRFKTGCGRKSTIVIDPTLAWGTYYGGAETGSSTVVRDIAGDIFLTGATHSTTNIATTGAYQITFGGGMQDVFVAKFTSTGSLLWATYYGGSGNEVAYSACSDATGAVYIGGYTTIDDVIPTPGAHQTTYGGGAYDAFLAKFSTEGTLVWGTYYGGSDYDFGTAVCCDHSGSVYLAGITQSLTNIATPGAYQTANNGDDDVFLAKFDSTGILQWGTYFGGDSIDESMYSIACDVNNNIYITGETQSPTNIATAGAWQTVIGDSSDAFLAKFSSNGTLIWSTYYGGIGTDYGAAVSVDPSMNIILWGLTGSTDNIATPGTHQETYSGGEDCFLAKFDSVGTRIWGTYYGGGNYDEPGAMICDNWGNIFIAGNTQSMDGIATTDAYQGGYNGTLDVFAANFDQAGSLHWGTYFGSGGYCRAAGVAADNNGSVYISGGAENATGMTTIGAYQVSEIGTGNAFLAKFSGFPDAILDITSQLQNVFLFPDPSSGDFTVTGTFSNEKTVIVTILNMLDEVVYTMPFALQQGVLNQEIDMKSAARGCYILWVHGGNSCYSAKFTIN